MQAAIHEWLRTRETYEDRQVDRAVRVALHKYDGSPTAAAEAYGLDVRKMIAYDSAYWDALGVIRLYARIAAHLALDVLEARGESRMGL